MLLKGHIISGYPTNISKYVPMRMSLSHDKILDLGFDFKTPNILSTVKYQNCYPVYRLCEACLINCPKNPEKGPCTRKHHQRQQFVSPEMEDPAVRLLLQ